MSSEETNLEAANVEEANAAEPAFEAAIPEVPKAQVARVRAAGAATPSAEQLTASRAAHWHQDGNALLSIETLRAWVTRSGLVLYAPKPQLGAPAPTLVEATLGKANPTPELAELDAAKNLTARLIAEGNAVPLNLLGVTGANGTDVPDFVVSAAVFSYIFTLRGNKAWKQSPVTSGAVKVSPLALATYELLGQKVTMSAYDLATQLGNGVTEGAVLRSLTELWSQLRVLPVPQQDGSAALWELATGRFTKQIKAGANAGQPSALSALISLYLAQAVVATEDEIESFLSPLAPRSRVRDVIHALLSARQLETLVIDGKTLLHVGGELPAFAAIASTADDAVEGEADASGEEGGSRIKKFAAKPGSKIGTGLRAKPAFGSKPGFGGKPAFGSRPSSGVRPSFGDRASSGSRPGFGAKPAFGGGDRERRPFKKDGGFAKPAFDKPWQEDRKPRPAASSDGAPSGAEGGEFRPARTFERRPAGDRPSFTRKPFGDRGAEGRPPRREFTPREGSDGPRKTFSKPGTFGRKREGGFVAREGAEGRPPRRDFGGDRPERSDRPAGGGFKRPGSYSPRPSGPAYGGSNSTPRAGFSKDRGAEGGEAPRKVFRKFDAPRSPKPFGSKPSFGPKPSFGSKPSFGPKKFEGGDRPERPKRAFDGPRPERPERSERPRSEGRPSFGAKPGGFGAKKPFTKAAGFAARGGPFAKFADGNKPFRKPGAPKKPGGGFKPTSRRGDGQ